jgi:hypothetical protein
MKDLVLMSESADFNSIVVTPPSPPSSGESFTENTQTCSDPWCLQDRRCALFVVQSVLGFFMLGFCAFQLSGQEDCHLSGPYWGLVGTVTGFFFQKLSVQGRINR